MKLLPGRCPGKADAIFLFICEKEKSLSPTAKEVDQLSKAGIRRLLEMGFKAKRKDCELLVLPEESRARWKLAVLLGLGTEKDLSGEVFREAVSAGLRRLFRYQISRIEVELRDFGNSGFPLAEEARAVAETFYLATYSYQEFKTRERESRLRISEIYFPNADIQLKKILHKMMIIGEEHCYVRDLINKPGSELWPERFAKETQVGTRQLGISVKVYDEKALARMGYNGILRVGQGSKNPPRLIELRYNGEGRNSSLIGLIGKGITFDTGGISLKPPERMEQMKADMSGAGIVLGVIRCLARLRLKLNVVGILPLAENMPGGGAQRPGDIIRMGNGTTVEVISTDAEGRLILADALYHCQKLKPKQLIDIATLTGACKIALGRFAIALMGNNEELLSALSHAGALTGERCWILPLWDEYLDLLKSDVADLKNGNWNREAGTIIGGIFLKSFVKDVPWAHLDIASVDWANEPHPYLGKGPTAKGLRLLVRYLEEISEKGGTKFDKSKTRLQSE